MSGLPVSPNKDGITSVPNLTMKGEYNVHLKSKMATRKDLAKRR